jgi:hypothetical protein
MLDDLGGGVHIHNAVADRSDKSRKPAYSVRINAVATGFGKQSGAQSRAIFAEVQPQKNAFQHLEEFVK